MPAAMLLAELDDRVADAVQAKASSTPHAGHLRGCAEAAEAVRDASAKPRAFATAHRQTICCGGNDGEAVEIMFQPCLLAEHLASLNGVASRQQGFAR